MAATGVAGGACSSVGGWGVGDTGFRPEMTPSGADTNPTMESTICHVDMDAFFVSVELRRRPELRGQPVVVGGTGSRGVVAAASYEARRYGVRSAMPSAVARQRCPDAVFLPGDMVLYEAVAHQIREIFGRYTPLVEPLSVDEAFLDVSGARRLFGSGVEIGHQIRSTVADELDLTCSVGVAPNKFLAKLASVEAKPQIVNDRRGRVTVVPGHGVFEVRPDRIGEYLQPLPIERLWGVGPKTQKRLHDLGVHTVADLVELGEDVVVRTLGNAGGRHLWALAHGRDERPVVIDHAAKSISHEQTYANNKHSQDELHVELVRQADAVASRLRRSGLTARTLTVKVRFDDGFRTITRSTTLVAGVNNAFDIVEALEPVVAGLDPTPGVRLFGIAATGFAQAGVDEGQQMSIDDIFSVDNQSPDWDAAASAIDGVRARFGEGAIGPAATLDGQKMRLIRRGEQQWGPDAADKHGD